MPFVGNEIWRRTSYAEQQLTSPVETCSPTSFAATRIIFIDGSTAVKRANCRTDFLGNTEVGTAQSLADNAPAGTMVRYLDRTIPHMYPNSYGVHRAFCRNVARIEPVTEPGYEQNVGLNNQGGMVSYGAAKVQLDYQTVPYKILENSQVRFPGDPLAPNNFPAPMYEFPDDGLLRRYIMRRFRPAGKILMLPNGFFCYVPPAGQQPVPIPMGFGLVQPRTELEYTWLEVPDAGVPWSLITGGGDLPGSLALGKLNSTAFDEAYWGRLAFAPETLLLVDIKIDEHVNVLGDLAFNITYKMIYSPNYSTVNGGNRGWNWFVGYLQPLGQTNRFDYRQVASYARQGGIFNIGKQPVGDPGQYPYDVIDFHNLFRPTQP